MAGAAGTAGIARPLQSSGRAGGASAYCPAASAGGGNTRLLKFGVGVVAQLLGLDRCHAGHHHHGFVGRKLHHFARRQQRAGRLLARHHQVAQPRREPVAGVVALGAQLGGGAQRLGDAFGGALVVRGERHADMAVVENRMVLAVGLVDLVERLRDEEAADAVARHEGQRRLEEVQAAQRRELVEHQQQLVAALDAVAAVERFGEPPPDLVEDQADERLRAAKCPKAAPPGTATPDARTRSGRRCASRSAR